jgi:uncharacterized membrane protein
MNRLWLPLVLVVVAIGLSVAEVAYRYPQLPDRVATHFNAAGQADGWTSKRQFTTLWFAGMGMLGFTFAMVCVIVSVIPASTINVPHKDYWLSPEHAPQTRRMIVERVLWFTAALMLFMAYVAHATLEVNLKRADQLTIWTPLGIFFAFTLLWSGELIWRFQRVQEEIYE